MSKTVLSPGTLISPLPAAMISCGDMENSNIITVAWTGIMNTKPPVAYISVRPTRHSYNIIKETGEFVINLTTSEMVRQTDLCGVKSGKDNDKFALCSLHKVPASKVACPVIEESPLSLECKVREIIPMGSHDVFIADIVATDADDRFMTAEGKIDLAKADIMAYSHGEYFSLGKKIGSFGYSVRKKKKTHKKRR